MKQRYISKSKEETWQIAKEVLDNLQDVNVIALQGELGAGKTTFSQGPLQAAGAEGPFTSPTFVIMKRYSSTHEKFQTIYHLDCYRIGSQDVIELGWQEIISNPQNLVLVEWSEKIKDVLPTHVLKINFSITNENTREITMNLSS